MSDFKNGLGLGHIANEDLFVLRPRRLPQISQLEAEQLNQSSVEAGHAVDKNRVRAVVELGAIGNLVWAP